MLLGVTIADWVAAARVDPDMAAGVLLSRATKVAAMICSAQWQPPGTADEIASSVIARAWLRTLSARAPGHPDAPLDAYLGRIARGELARLRSDARRWLRLSDRDDDVESRAHLSESAEVIEGPEDSPALRRCVRRARAIADKLRDGLSESERRGLFRRLARLASKALKLRGADASAAGPPPATISAAQALRSPSRTRVQRLASDGLSRGEISRMLSVSEDTVKKHLRALRSAAPPPPLWDVPR